MKNEFDIINLSIFQEGTLPLLHMEFSCRQKGNDVTKSIFDTLTHYATQKGIRWYQIHPSLQMSYNHEKNTIEFMEIKGSDSNKAESSALTLLPSLLLRDWGLINNEVKELLEKFIKLHPLTENASLGQTNNFFRK